MENLDYNEVIISHLKEVIPKVRAIWIFGSYQTKYYNRLSDIDIAFLAAKPVDNVFRWDVQEGLAAKLHRDVDLVDLSAVSLVMKNEVTSKGKRIYCDNENEILDYEILVLSQYLDFQETRKPLIEAILARGSVYGN